MVTQVSRPCSPARQALQFLPPFSDFWAQSFPLAWQWSYLSPLFPAFQMFDVIAKLFI